VLVAVIPIQVNLKDLWESAEFVIEPIPALVRVYVFYHKVGLGVNPLLELAEFWREQYFDTIVSALYGTWCGVFQQSLSLEKSLNTRPVDSILPHKFEDL
jgi:hypothetical protein